MGQMRKSEYRISNIEVRNKETNPKRIFLGLHCVIISNAPFISVPLLVCFARGAVSDEQNQVSLFGTKRSRPTG
jgi:xanthine/uracil permease